MRQLDVNRLKPDTLAKTVSALDGKFVSVTGYIRSVDAETISICRFRTSRSHIEFPSSAVLAAVEDEEERDSRVTLLIARDAKVQVVTRCDASQIETGACGCEPADLGVAEARPYGSIHPELGKFMAEMLKIKGAVGTGAGARFLKCETAYQDAVLAGKLTVDEAQRKRDLCLLGIDEPDDPTRILW